VTWFKSEKQRLIGVLQTANEFFKAAGKVDRKFDFEVVKEGVWLNYAGSHTGEFISSGHIPQQSNFLDFINFIKGSK